MSRCSSASPAFVEAYKLRWIDGSDNVIRNLSPTRSWSTTDAKDNGLHVGSRITLENRAGKQSPLRRRGHRQELAARERRARVTRGFAPLADTKGVAFMFVMTDPNANLDTVQAR